MDVNGTSYQHLTGFYCEEATGKAMYVITSVSTDRDRSSKMLHNKTMVQCFTLAVTMVTAGVAKLTKA